MATFDQNESVINQLSIIKNPENDPKFIKIGPLLAEIGEGSVLKGPTAKASPSEDGRGLENLNPIIFS